MGAIEELKKQHSFFDPELNEAQAERVLSHWNSNPGIVDALKNSRIDEAVEKKMDVLSKLKNAWRNSGKLPKTGVGLGALGIAYDLLDPTEANADDTTEPGDTMETWEARKKALSRFKLEQEDKMRNKLDNMSSLNKI